MSKTKKSKDMSSIINVRALCEQCKDVDTFQISTRDLLPHIGGLYQVSTIHHCKEDRDMIMTIVLDRNYAVRQTSVSPFVGDIDFDSADGEDKWSDEEVADVKFLVSQIKEADKVINAVLSSKQVVVVSNNVKFVRRIIHTLQLFSPEKYPQSIDWTEKTVKNKMLIGTKPDLINEYKEAIIVDLDSNKVIRGKTSLYSRKFLNSLVKLEPKGMAYAAKLKIDMLIEFSKMVIELSKESEIGPKAIELVKMDVSEDAYELILDIVAGFDPSALEIIKSNWL
ncbi:MAG: hypothetical protein ACFFDW_13050 [Candidatus Thorarchaeota archaeon]